MDGRTFATRFVASLVALLLVACGDRAAPAGGTGAGEESRPPASAPQATGSIGAEEVWFQSRPELSLLLVGNQRGKLKPCGCSEPQLGGLERLALFLDASRRRARSAFAPLSLGWSFKDVAEAQAETKVGLYRAALDLLGFQALLLGTTDLGIPALAQPFLDGRPVDLPAPPGNAPISRSGPLARAADTEPLVTLQVGELTVRALSMLDPEQGARLGGVVETVLPPGGALQLLSPRPDALWIVSTDGNADTVRGLEQAVARLGPAVIVDFGGGGGAERLEGVRLEDGPFVVTLADLGKEVGLLDLDRDGETGGWILSYHVVPLAPWMETPPSALREGVARLFEAYKRQVRERRYLESFETYPDPDAIGYVGSSRCARCHPGIYEQWIGTAHARALRTLSARGYDWDPECVRCHVVGWQRLNDGRWGRMQSGFLDGVRTPHLGGVGCESCHGPGAAHVESPWDATLWGAQGPGVRDPGRKGCAVCHDVENSFGFQEEYASRFLPAVDHREVPSDRRVVVPAED